MPRPQRTAVGDLVYHVLNRANGRMPLFEKRGDYQSFLKVFAQAHEKVSMCTLAYCIMPNHWHMVLWPKGDRDLSVFMHWLTTTHTQRWLTERNIVGFGHVYKGRFKSFAVQDDHHYLTVCRYVERNALRAGLVESAQDWPWCSAHQRLSGATDGVPPLDQGPLAFPDSWLDILNTDQDGKEVQAVRGCLVRDRPYGEDHWVEQAAQRLGLPLILRSRGRPKGRKRGLTPFPANPMFFGSDDA